MPALVLGSMQAAGVSHNDLLPHNLVLGGATGGGRKSGGLGVTRPCTSSAVGLGGSWRLIDFGFASWGGEDGTRSALQREVRGRRAPSWPPFFLDEAPKRLAHLPLLHARVSLAYTQQPILPDMSERREGGGTAFKSKENVGFSRVSIWCPGRLSRVSLCGRQRA